MKENRDTLVTDFCVIGGGSGGLSFAAGAAQMGSKVILIESNIMGGDCLNTGCVPSKALLSAAKFGIEAKHARDFGWQFDNLNVNYARVNDYVQSVIKKIAPNDSIARFESMGVKVITDTARFVDPKTIETEKYIIKSKYFIIATGSKPFIPPINGLRDVVYYTNQNIFDLKELPEHLVIIGGGPIGLELAQAFNNLGSKVIVLEAFTALPKDDPELTGTLKQVLRDQSIELLEHIQIESLKQISNKIQISCLDQNKVQMNFEATHLLVAAGRRANIEQLNLDLASIKYKPQGIIVDKYLRTTNPKVYAIGDCVGGLQFTHVAGYHAGLVIRNSIFKLKAKVEIKAIPWVTYLEPELAQVGLQELQAKELGIKHTVLRLSFEDNDRAQTENKTKGMIKVIASPGGYVLGVSILGHMAGELIYPWVIAINCKLKLSDIASSIAPYPTLNELNKRVAGNFYAPKLFSRYVKWLTRLLLKMST